MSTVVDNNKYIINGSTLSDIGDALRESGVAPTQKKIQVTRNVYYKKDTATSRNLTADWFGLSSQTPSKVLIHWNSVSGAITSPVSITNIWMDEQYVIDLPCSFRGQQGSYTSYNYNVNLYPLDSQGNFIIPTQQDNMSSYQVEERTFWVPNPATNFLVSDIASLIQNNKGAKFAAIWPFNISGFTYDLTDSTDISQYISDINDIVALYFVESVNGSNYYWYKLQPSQSSFVSTSHGPGYKLKRYKSEYSATKYSNTTSSDEGALVFWHGRLWSTYSKYTARFMPAILIYK